MGLRQALVRWLVKDEETKRALAAADDSSARHGMHGADGAVATPADQTPPAPLPAHPDAPTTILNGSVPLLPVQPEGSPPQQPSGAYGPSTGGLVVGQANHRPAPVALPAFYEPPPAPPVHDAMPKLADYDRQKVVEAWEMVSERVDQLVKDFYAELFVRVHEAPQMFPSSMVQQRLDFGRALVQWLVSDDPDSLTAHLDQLGADHRKFDVEPRHYDVAGAAIVSAWKRLAGPKFTPAHEQALVGSYTRMASIMIAGAMRRQHEPASWGAQVIEHRRIYNDFAVLRIQPDAPYPYKPGQYLTVEVPTHRREWRQMSIASAPRGDNTFDLHVRAIGASGVSAALVMHTRAGSRLRLGPPRGNDLVVEPGTVPGGLLCVASGTGAAPITAVVESILGWKEPPSQLFAFVGGRTRDDIYPVEQLNQLIRSGDNWRHAQVYGVVSDDPEYAGYRGRVELIVPKLQNWAQLGVDVLVSGPSAMIATTVTSLAGAGVPLGKIHFDQYEMAA